MQAKGRIDGATAADGRVPPPPRQTKQARVYAALRDAILRCELAPGQRLIIDDIAKRFAVSPIPVREALQLLQSEGLVTTVPHGGATVAPISPDSVLEIFTLMEGLELIATRIAADRLSLGDIEELRADVAAMDTALAEHDPERWAALNRRFHGRIVQITRMPLLQETSQRVQDHWDRVRRHFFPRVLHDRIEQAEREHREILQAMLDRDYPRLNALAIRHNQGALASYLRRLGERES